MKNSIEIYKGKDNQTQIEVKFENNTVWLSQKQIAGVFGTEVPAINKHIKNIIKEGELDAKATISKMEIVGFLTIQYFNYNYNNINYQNK